MDPRQVLKSCNIFKGLNSLELLKMTEISRRVFLNKGELIISEGENFEVDSSLYVIASGLVKVSLPLGTGKELVLAILGPSGHFGELSFVDGDPRSADVIAMEDSELLKLDHEALADLLKSDNGLSLKFYKSISAVLVNKLREMNEKARGGQLSH
jgi:CRP/FNR family transcriptional regulator/CRP/FNR family cyclic AMP-dependent transcriptional regulator